MLGISVYPFLILLCVVAYFGCLTCLQPGKKASDLVMNSHLWNTLGSGHSTPQNANRLGPQQTYSLSKSIHYLPKTIMGLFGFGHIQLQDYASPVFEATFWCSWPVMGKAGQVLAVPTAWGFLSRERIILFREKSFFPKKKQQKKNVRFAEKIVRFVANTCAM